MRPGLHIFALAAALVAGGLVKAQDGTQQQPESGTSAISGVVTDGLTGRPMAGAVVYAGITGRGAGRTSRQLTDRKGRFVFTDLPAHEQYFLNASGFGYVNGGYGATPVTPAPTRIRLGQGEWFKDVHIKRVDHGSAPRRDRLRSRAVCAAAHVQLRPGVLPGHRHCG